MTLLFRRLLGDSSTLITLFPPHFSEISCYILHTYNGFLTHLVIMLFPPNLWHFHCTYKVIPAQSAVIKLFPAHLSRSSLQTDHVISTTPVKLFPLNLWHCFLHTFHVGSSILITFSSHVISCTRITNFLHTFHVMSSTLIKDFLKNCYLNKQINYFLHAHQVIFPILVKLFTS